MWLKQRFAHLVLLPSVKNPMVRRWQRPFRTVGSITELTETWESGTFATYKADPERCQQVADFINSVDPDLGTPVATDGQQVYALARGLPMWSDLDALLSDTPHLKHTIITNYARALNAVRNNMRVGDLVSALAYGLKLRDDTDYFEEGKVKVAPVSDEHASGAHFFGMDAAYQAVNSIPHALLKRIADRVNSTVVLSQEASEASRRIERVKDVLFRDLGGRWEHINGRQLSAKLKPDRLKQFAEDLSWLMEFVHAHRPDIAEMLGLTDDEGNLQIQHWDKIRDKVLAGGRDIKGHPTLIDTAQYIVSKIERDRQADPDTLTLIFGGLSKSDLRSVVQPFRKALDRPITPELKETLSRHLAEADLPDDLKERFERLLKAEKWRDVFAKHELAEAFQFYLFTLMQVAN